MFHFKEWFSRLLKAQRVNKQAGCVMNKVDKQYI